MGEEGSTDATNLATAVHSLTHAQLAVAEQLRLGNLIAYSSMLDHQYQMANERGEADIKFTVDQEGLDASLARKHAAQVEVAAALGVSNE